MQAVLRANPHSVTRLLAASRVAGIPSSSSRAAFCARSAYSTVVYHGQRPASKEPQQSQQQQQQQPLKIDADPEHVFGSEVKLNPSESEADVAADRGEIDPLPMGMHRTILVDAGETAVYTRPTDSEEVVRADRDPENPLGGKTGATG